MARNDLQVLLRLVGLAAALVLLSKVLFVDMHMEADDRVHHKSNAVSTFRDRSHSAFAVPAHEAPMTASPPDGAHQPPQQVVGRSLPPQQQWQPQAQPQPQLPQQTPQAPQPLPAWEPQPAVQPSQTPTQPAQPVAWAPDTPVRQQPSQRQVNDELRFDDAEVEPNSGPTPNDADQLGRGGDTFVPPVPKYQISDAKDRDAVDVWGPPPIQKPDVPDELPGTDMSQLFVEDPSGPDNDQVLDDIGAAPSHTHHGFTNEDHHEVPIAHDLAWHKANKHCWEHFDIGLLEEWERKRETFCAPIGGKQGSHLECRETLDHHLPRATAPHTFCEVTNVGFDFTKMKPAKCQKHRRGYKCKGEAIFYSYHKGALLGACRKSKAFQLRRFPRDHLRDIFDGFKPVRRPQDLPQYTYDAPVTLFITRERQEHANFFHAMTDFVNAYQALHMVGVIDARREGHRKGMENVAVVLLDEQDEGPFDMVYDMVYSPNYPVKRVHHFKKAGHSEVLFRRGVFVHPGYTNWLFVQLEERGSCEKELQLLQSFREFFLDGMGIETHLKKPGDKIRIVMISRRPYNKFVEHKFMGRQVSNEDQLVRAMKKLPNVEVRLEDFAQITFQEQIHLVASTDLMIGMHGAALTHALFLPPWGALLELWPKTRAMWRCFEHWAQLAGHRYNRYENRKRSNFKKDKHGDYTRIEVGEFMTKVKGLLKDVRKKREELDVLKRKQRHA